MDGGQEFDYVEKPKQGIFSACFFQLNQRCYIHRYEGVIDWESRQDHRTSEPRDASVRWGRFGTLLVACAIPNIRDFLPS